MREGVKERRGEGSGGRGVGDVEGRALGQGCVCEVEEGECGSRSQVSGGQARGVI